MAATVPEAFARRDVGPHTRAVLERARTVLAAGNGAIGRWPEPPAPRRKGARHFKL